MGRSTSVPRHVKTEGNKIATGTPAAHISGHDGIGRHARFRFSCSDALGFESPCPHQTNIIRTYFQSVMGSDDCFSLTAMKPPASETRRRASREALEEETGPINAKRTGAAVFTVRPPFWPAPGTGSIHLPVVILRNLAGGVGFQQLPQVVVRESFHRTW